MKFPCELKARTLGHNRTWRAANDDCWMKSSKASYATCTLPFDGPLSFYELVEVINKASVTYVWMQDQKRTWTRAHLSTQHDKIRGQFDFPVANRQSTWLYLVIRIIWMSSTVTPELQCCSQKASSYSYFKDLWKSTLSFWWWHNRYAPSLQLRVT